MTAVPATPAGYHAITPYLTIKGTAAALEFYKKAFGAVELMRLEMGPNVIGHAEIKIEHSRYWRCAGWLGCNSQRCGDRH